ncbi:MAG: class I SAM-dependent methyltransferase [Nevskia sp.]|nr:class I SAM-dependent methyltransferase [Nevskia sp.]
MNRIRVVQACLDKVQNRTYLEIGVSTGSCFSKIRASTKYAVDPEFKIPERRRRDTEKLADKTSYFEVTSDAFFASNRGLLESSRIGVALVDGLHTYKQSLHDVLNILPYLDDDGFIVMHDCRPRFASEARPAANHGEFMRTGKWWEIAWTGDVWKAVVELRATRSDLRVAVLDCDCGVGIIRRGKPDDMLALKPEAIAAMTYQDLVKDKQHLLNLRKPDYFWSFLL